MDRTAKRRRPTYAFAAVHERGGVNTYWIRATAKAVRDGADHIPWEDCKRLGWRVRKVIITLA